HVRSVNFVRRPGGGFEPHYAAAVPAAAQEIRLAIAVEVGNHDVRSAILVRRDEVLLPRPSDVGRLLPPGEPVAGRSALGGAGYVRTSVAIDVADGEVMVVSGRIAVRDDKALPSCRRSRVLRDPEPCDRIREIAISPAAGGNELWAAVAVEVRKREAMHSV